jgi:hypothetical protein
MPERLLIGAPPKIRSQPFMGPWNTIILFLQIPGNCPDLICAQQN